MRNLVISQSITEREYKSLDKYFSEVEKISTVTPEEEVLLAKKIKQGDRAALERLTTANLRFVISVAKQYQHIGLTLGDLVNEGNMGLMTAAKRYDESKGFKFISYAVWWIRQSIISAVAEHARTVRLPYNKLTLLTKIQKAFGKLEQEHSRRPTPEELGDYLGISAVTISELLSRSGTGMSLYESFSNDDGFLPIDMLQHTGGGPDDKIMFDSVKAEIKYSMRVLNERERNILILYFGLGASTPLRLEEIGERYQITEEHTRRLKERALQKLRESTNGPVLRSYLN